MLRDVSKGFNMKAPDLASLLPRFFAEYLVQQRNLSPCTISAYRDTFRLLLRYLQRARRIQPSRLPLAALNASSIMAFLSHLERERHNAIRSRNARLAAIRSFIHFASDLIGPEFPEATRRILAVPFKRHTRPVLNSMTREEVQAILATVGESWTGRRDHLLFFLLYNTGARVSEVLALRVCDVFFGNGGHVIFHGKGRKERQVPLWRRTNRELQRWIKSNQLSAEDFVFRNRYGQPISRSGVAWQLRRHLKQASQTTQSLSGKHISAHTFRHTTAMHMLQSGVPSEVIALWLGHESPNTTHLYVEADLDMKRRTLEAVAAPMSKAPRHRSDDRLLQFLKSL